MVDSIKLFIAISSLLAACSISREQAAPTLRENTPTSLQFEVSILPLESNQAGTTIIVEGTVESASPSARIIMLTQPVNGFEVIVLTDSTSLRDEQGNGQLLHELQLGTEVRSVGEPGKAGALLADDVSIHD